SRMRTSGDGKVGRKDLLGEKILEMYNRRTMVDQGFYSQTELYTDTRDVYADTELGGADGAGDREFDIRGGHGETIGNTEPESRRRSKASNLSARGDFLGSPTPDQPPLSYKHAESILSGVSF